MNIIKDLPFEIIIKYFIRAYTKDISLQNKINESLIKQNQNEYITFVKIMFKGLSNKSLFTSEDEYLYYGTILSKEKIDKIKSYEFSDVDYDKFPSYILYSKCFLSFSKDENIARQFMGSTDDRFCGVLFKLYNNSSIETRHCPNADIEFLSAFPYEKTVLFFPYSTFCV